MLAETEEEEMFFHSAPPLPSLTRQSLLLPLHALFVFSLPEQASCQGAYDQSIWNVDE